jgi:hypothetical protein
MGERGSKIASIFLMLLLCMMVFHSMMIHADTYVGDWQSLPYGVQNIPSGRTFNEGDIVGTTIGWWNLFCFWVDRVLCGWLSTTSMCLVGWLTGSSLYIFLLIISYTNCRLSLYKGFLFCYFLCIFAFNLSPPSIVFCLSTYDPLCIPQILLY